MSLKPVDPEIRDELLVQSAKIVMRGTDNSVWCSAVLPVLLEEESVDRGDPRIDGRRIVGVTDFLPSAPTSYQEDVYSDFNYAVRSRLFPRYYHLQSTTGLEEEQPEKQTTDPNTIEYEHLDEHPSLKPESTGRRFRIPLGPDEDTTPPAGGLTEKKRQKVLKKAAENAENTSRFKKAVTQIAGLYLGGHPSPDGMSPDESILSRAQKCVAGKASDDMNYFHLFLALSYRNALCKLADRYVVLVAAAPGGVLCANWDPSAAGSLGDNQDWYRRLWKGIYMMELFPPPSTAGEQGTSWTKPSKYLAAALIFARNDEATVDEKLNWLFAVKTKVLDAVCRGLLIRDQSVAKLRQEVSLSFGLFLREPFPEKASSNDSSTETVRPGGSHGGKKIPKTNAALDTTVASEALAILRGIDVPQQA